MREHLANLGSLDGEAAKRAERLLIRHYAVVAVSDCIALCASENPKVRFRAVWVLGYSRSPGAYEAIRRLCDDPDDQVRYDAVMALGVFGDERAIPYLIDCANSADPTRPGKQALYRLGAIAVPRLRSLLESPDPWVREWVGDLIEAIVSDEVQPGRFGACV